MEQSGLHFNNTPQLREGVELRGSYPPPHGGIPDPRLTRGELPQCVSQGGHLKTDSIPITGHGGTKYRSNGYNIIGEEVKMSQKRRIDNEPGIQDISTCGGKLQGVLSCKRNYRFRLVLSHIIRYLGVFNHGSTEHNLPLPGFESVSIPHDVNFHFHSPGTSIRDCHRLLSSCVLYLTFTRRR